MSITKSIEERLQEKGLEGWNTENMEPSERFDLIEGIIKDLLRQIEQTEQELEGAEKAIKTFCRILSTRDQGLALNADERRSLMMLRSSGLIAGLNESFMERE